jgi:hypothetical protein
MHYDLCRAEILTSGQRTLVFGRTCHEGKLTLPVLHLPRLIPFDQLPVIFFSPLIFPGLISEATEHLVIGVCFWMVKGLKGNIAVRVLVA